MNVEDQDTMDSPTPANGAVPTEEVSTTGKVINSSSSSVGSGTVNVVPMPKHIPFPEFSGNSELLNELIMFLFITCAAAMQFINIYRTVWWLQESHIKHTVNVYLIEPYLVVLIILMTARRLIYCLLVRALGLMNRTKQQRIYRSTLKYGFAMILLGLLSLCIIKICIRHSYLSLFLLVYPLIVYLLIFGFQIEPFLRSSCEMEGVYFNDMPMHCCSSNATTIRDEIEVLKNDFNNRFKQIIFTSVINAYYAGFVPCFFAVSVYYNVIWATQHIFFIWLSGFTMCIIFILPSKYSDILHRASLHLGYWHRMEVRPSSGGLISAAAAAWNKSVVWTNGSVVKHNGELFRCSGPITVALPGHTSHSRFYKLFHNPSLIYMTFTTIQAAIVITEIVLLYYTIEWHFLLSISFITLTNQFTFFKIMRDYLITKRIYTAEIAITDKQLNSSHYN